MTCGRSAGLMQKDILMDPLNESGQIWAVVWRCFNCGEVFDHLILQNRKFLQPPTNGKARFKTTDALPVLRIKLKECPD